MIGALGSRTVSSGGKLFPTLWLLRMYMCEPPCLSAVQINRSSMSMPST